MGLTLGLLLVLSIRQVASLDAGFHLKSGAYILAGHAPPSTDQFTFTIRDHPVVNMTWGYDVLLALTERAAGAPGLVLLHAFFILAIFIVVFLTARLGPADPTTLAVLLLLGVVASEMRFDIRPELVSYLFLVLVLYVLHRHAEGRTSPLWSLPLLHVLWANLHSLFILGWVAIGCFVVGLGLRRMKLDLRLLAWGAASVAVTVLNPYGIRGVLFPFTLATRLQQENVFAQSIGEFTSPFAMGLSAQFPFYPRAPIFAFRVLVALSVLALIPLLRRKRYWCVLLWVAFLVLSSRMVRNIPIFVIACLPGAIWGLPIEGPAKLLGEAFSRRRSKPSAAGGRSGRGVNVAGKQPARGGRGSSKGQRPEGGSDSVTAADGRSSGAESGAGKRSISRASVQSSRGTGGPGERSVRDTSETSESPRPKAGGSASVGELEKRVKSQVPLTERLVAAIPRVTLAATALCAISLACRTMTDAYYIGSRRMERFGLGWNHLVLPIEAVEYATRAGVAGPVLNHLNFGGFLMWARPDPVFIDGRLEVVGEAFFEEYQRALSSEAALESCVQRYGIKWAIFPYAGFPKLLAAVGRSHAWRLAYADHIAAIFVRAAPDAGRFVDPDLASAAPPSNPPGALRALPGIEPAASQGGSSEIARWVTEHFRRQEFPAVDFNLGIFRLYRGELPLAEERFIKAIQSSGGAYYEIYSNLGAVLFREKRYAEARDCYRVVLEKTPGDRIAADRLREIDALAAGRAPVSLN